jgi:hypothetical protein
MAGIVLALAGLTCGDGMVDGAAQEPVVAPVVFRLRTGWELSVHADPMRYRCETNSARDTLYLVERGTGRVLWAAYTKPGGVMVGLWRGSGSFEADGSFRYNLEPGGKPVFLSAQPVGPRKP